MNAGIKKAAHGLAANLYEHIVEAQGSRNGVRTTYTVVKGTLRKARWFCGIQGLHSLCLNALSEIRSPYRASFAVCARLNELQKLQVFPCRQLPK